MLLLCNVLHCRCSDIHEDINRMYKKVELISPLQTTFSVQTWQFSYSVQSTVIANYLLKFFRRLREYSKHFCSFQCREITFEIHEEILKVLHELHTAMKTNHTYQSEFRQAESKLAVVEKQRSKLKEQIPAEKLAKSRKFRLIEKELDKRKRKYTEARLKATRARNEYLLCMEAGNASLHKYYVDDLSDMLDCMDYGLHQSLARAVLAR